ncbi:MAG TPA: adenosylcobinamide-phosphate synthase CbiB [Rhabdaerophilum sp.]|nr:adenosylcobinamide-phosphate synthase CbiB [Rhabdaerophilum sp.]
MLAHSDAFVVLFIALLADALIGDPDFLWRRLPHPVAWIGAMIAGLDRRLNHEPDSLARRQALGVIALGAVLTVSLAAALALDAKLRSLPGHPWTSGLFASVLIAQNSLYRHVREVFASFRMNGIEAARSAVSMIVGRDPAGLDEAAICRAAIESAAENFSDGIVAPAFWFAVLGLPGLVLYKAINTADSMIGHRSARHEAFGWAAARLDDAVNLVPARLAGLLLVVAAPAAGGSPLKAIRVMLRDASLHRSPNAGWPEAAMAGALDLALAGPRQYAAHRVDDPFLNAEGRIVAAPADIGRALRILIAACVLLAALVGALGWLTSGGGATG